MTRPRVLVVDDKENIRHLLERILGVQFEVVLAADGDAAVVLLKSEAFDVVLSDIKMPGKDGLEVLRVAKAIAPATEVVLMTAFASVQSAVEAIRAGAFDYLPKPFDPDDALLKVERAAERKALKDRAEGLERDLLGRRRFGELMGKSEAMQRVFTLLEKAAGRDLSVLLLGESGTGKELAARAIHHGGRRKHEPFVPINCGALPGALIESELFGHRKGAFTGADSDRAGLMEEAGHGTVFLDEVGELPLALQVKLNRVLQERELRRVGETKSRKLEARVIAATNRDLPSAIAAGQFREDLYYRLNVFPIALPSLRNRKEDVPLLAQHFLDVARTRSTEGPRSISPETMRALLAYDYPGNVRELENIIERAVAVAESDLVERHDLPSEALGNAEVAGDAALRPVMTAIWSEGILAGTLSYRAALEQAQGAASAAFLEHLLAHTAGNVSLAAEQAGLARESLHRLLRRHGIEPARFRR